MTHLTFQIPKNVKSVEQQRLEEKQKRRDALELIRHQAREKALEEKRTKVRCCNFWYISIVTGFKVQWGSEQRTSLVFNWSKTICLSNGLLFKPCLE